ncbi:preprotein translocase subunit SecE [Caulobacter sp. 17J65-9]|uniref:preprotein translocase subunit SecE n=1 Tax=Caulobacter sp. 17J65-9 TaxID=2709382 RepID=UPI0013CC4E7E|nr:preprotein translocase subunit SecE [Caulobacter sp. 17J65-9]NEX93059.1 preprotein translocase subunit SecE [Caulobacter sp. 17J65-9]
MAKQQAPTALNRGARAASGRGAPQKPVIDAEAPARKKRVSPAQYFREVRAEARKITWTSRKETWITSVMVFIMVLLATFFFWVVDFLMGFGVAQVLKIGG